MPRRPRADHPGAWHHVMNRGIARRSLFETKRDVGGFLSRWIAEAKSGEIEIHAFAVLTTHFHFLLRSPRGHLSAVMQRVQDAYARRFNRERRRDGPLFRGRFVNRLVETEAHWLAVLRYIDRNPVEAGLAAHPVDYPFGSARFYGTCAGPPWLRREVVEATAAADSLRGFRPGDYAGFGEGALAGSARWLVEGRLGRASPGGADPLDDLVGAAPERIRDWMERKALLADGTSPGWVLAHPPTVLAVVKERAPGGPGGGFGEALEAWLLRTCAGLTMTEVGRWTGRPVSTLHRRVRACAQALQRDTALRSTAAGVLAEILERDHGRSARRRVPLLMGAVQGPSEVPPPAGRAAR